MQLSCIIWFHYQNILIQAARNNNMFALQNLVDWDVTKFSADFNYCWQWIRFSSPKLMLTQYKTLDKEK